MRYRLPLIASAALLATISCLAAQQPAPPSDGQSVVDAAKQKSSGTKAKRIYTNDDLAPSPELASSSAQRGPDEQRAEQTQPEPTSADGRSTDRKPDAKAADQVSEAEKVVEARKIQIETMTDEKNRLDERLHQPGISADEYSTISESIRSIEHKLEGWKKQLDDAQKVVDAAKQSKQSSDAQ